MKTDTKIALITLSYVFFLLVAAFAVWVVLNMGQTTTVRVIIAAAGVVWAALSIWFVWFKTDYSRLWRQHRYRRQYKNIHKLRASNPRYEALYRKYPTSVRRHERHCVHHGIPPKEMIDSALQIPDEEWAASEAFRTQP